MVRYFPITAITKQLTTCYIWKTLTEWIKRGLFWETLTVVFSNNLHTWEQDVWGVRVLNACTELHPPLCISRFSQQHNHNSSWAFLMSAVHITSTTTNVLTQLPVISSTSFTLQHRQGSIILDTFQEKILKFCGRGGAIQTTISYLWRAPEGPLSPLSLT